MPSKAVRAAAAVTLGALLAAVVLVAAAQPAAVTWNPISRALEPLGSLVLGADEMRWSICRGARAVPAGADKTGTVYTLQGQPGCVLDGQRITHLKLLPRTQRCEAELSLYTSDKALREAAPEAWGLVERSPCP